MPDNDDLDLTEVDAESVEQHESDDVDHDKIPDGFAFEDDDDVPSDEDIRVERYDTASASSPELDFEEPTLFDKD